MTVFEAVKDSLDIAQVARDYGVQLVSSRLAHCPFHDDRHPSFSFYKNDKGEWKFKCHSGECNAYGDVIDLVARIECLDNLDATKELSDKYHLGIDFDKPIDRREQQRRQAVRDRQNALTEWIQEAYWTLNDYADLMDDWRKIYVPLHPSLPIPRRYVEAVSSRRDHAIYLQDGLLDCRGKQQAMVEFYMAHRAFIEELQNKLKEERLPHAGRITRDPATAAGDRTIYLPIGGPSIEAL